MNFQISDDASGVSIRISGDLDFGANIEFKKIIQRLDSVKGKSVTFDLSNVNRIDSVGLGLLYIAKEEVGTKIRLKSPKGEVLSMLKLTEADEDFDIHP
jgi:anti-anti-sigma factor